MTCRGSLVQQHFREVGEEEEEEDEEKEARPAHTTYCRSVSGDK